MKIRLKSRRPAQNQPPKDNRLSAHQPLATTQTAYQKQPMNIEINSPTRLRHLTSMNTADPEEQCQWHGISFAYLQKTCQSMQLFNERQAIVEAQASLITILTRTAAYNCPASEDFSHQTGRDWRIGQPPTEGEIYLAT